MQDLETQESPAAVRAEGGPAAPRTAGRRRFLALVGRYATLVGFVGVIIGFSLAKPDIFPTWTNARTILDQAAVVIILAVGLTVVVTTQEFDLSFTGVITLASVLSVMAMSNWHLGTVPAVLIGLAVGTGCGLIAGALVAARRASSFITTLALGTVWTGLAVGISKDKSSITDITTGYGNLTFWRPLGVPVNVFYALAVILLCYGLLRWTVFGRNASAVGANEIAARLAGLPLPQVRIGAFAVMGLCSGIAAVLISSRTGGYQPGVADGLLVPPFVAVFFGLSVLGRGRFNVPGTVLGALFIGTLQTGLNIIGKSGWVADVVVGTTLVIILFAASSVRESR